MAWEPGAWLAALRGEAGTRERAGLRRVLHPRTPDDRVIDLAGNDYLGLSRHPRVIDAAVQALQEYGLGATGSRLVRGTTSAHVDLEAALAGWLGVEATLVYSSGYLANVGALRALVTPGTLVISDAYNHASIVDGCRATRAQVVVVPHADLDAMKSALASASGRPAVIVTESVFSVDGDLAPLADMHGLARGFGARLLVDEAHACGLLGPAGAGGVAAAGLAGEPDIVVTATLSKSFGGSGGVVAGPRELIDALVDTGRTFIYDTALPPAVAAGALAALEIIRTDDALRADVVARGSFVRSRLGAAGLAVSSPAAGVLSVAAPSPEAALAWAAACRQRGVAVGCFRPPSTPDGSSRLRVTINAGVPRDAFAHALDVIVETAP
jgi:8-amino-7-oxononanoate synthase